jgi:O-antigen/teichoic acid export membrane protein
MTSKRRVGKNLVWNCAGTAFDALAGFLIAPFLIHRLGETTYGLWIVLGSLTSYFGLLDLGIRGSVGRHIAYHRARHDQGRVNETLSTAVAVLSGVGVLGMLGTFASSLFFFHLFAVPEDQVWEVRIALFVVGVNLAASLVLNAFDATLWGFQRFDRLNAVDMPTAAVRAGLTWYFVGHGGGLIALAVITLVLTLGNGTAKAVLSFLDDPGLRLGRRRVKLAATRELFGYSLWSFLATSARIARAQLSPVLIGTVLGVSLVTPFAVANRLVALTLLLVVILVVLGQPIIVAWVGPQLSHAAILLTILAIGELLPGSQYVTNSMIFATARHRALAFLAIIEVVTAGALAWGLGRSFGLIGLCVGIAVPGLICRGFGQIVLGCRIASVAPLRYVLTALIPPVACAAVPTACLVAVTRWRAPANLPEVALYALGFSVLYALCCVAVMGRDYLLRYWRSTRERDVATLPTPVTVQA